ncbi:hypothetical protein B0A49_02533 [Cryomyces minteri]|uniref:Formate/nitrite transporter n=1 Tax=Cryomyces minteri TaxID=331657 RepID=A0A4U0XZR4_9PEZI|nr:hypothetical protein B0A49_02533 [Cryomyces minteri]
MSSGALSPGEATEQLYQTGIHHLEEATQLTFLKNVYGGLLLSFGGLFSIIASAGCPGLEESNPGLVRLLQGITFPVGLVVVYFVGAELFTGYPMWLAMTALQRRGRPIEYVRGLAVSWLGNLVGALLVATFFSYLSNTLTEEPYRSGLVAEVTEDIVDAGWAVIFLRAIACGCLVTLAMFMGTQNGDGISKALGLHLPFFLATTARLPHTVKYMYYASAGMMMGAPLSVGGFLWKCMLPITLGNTIGGAVFTGAYNWWVFMYCEDQKAPDRFDGLDGGSDGGA